MTSDFFNTIGQKRSFGSGRPNVRFAPIVLKNSLLEGVVLS